MAVTTNYGAAPTYVKIASQTPGATTSVTFPNVPQSYTDLVLVINGYTSNSNVGDNIGLRFNADSGSNYSWTRMYGLSSTAASDRNTAQTLLGQAALGGGANYPSTITYNIQSYSNSNIYKTVLYKSNDGVTQVTQSIGLWRSTAPITSLTLSTYASSVNFGATTTFTLYGIKAAFVPKASGGDIIVQDGTYWYHAFRTTGVFTPNISLTADFLLIGGGGSGGSGFAGGGGGAGGHKYTSGSSLTANTAYTATVGAGGSGVGYVVTQGASSTFNSVTAYGGGGGGGSFNNAPTGTFGSGGGSGVSNAAQTGASGTSGQGNSGGNMNASSYNAPYGGAGGGGAGAAGANSSGTPTAGGVGLSTYGYFGALTGTGHNVSGTVYFAGGGGAGAGGNATLAVGGSGGGGTGGNSNSANTYTVTAPTSGLSATGGGGGGTAYYNIVANGGSGVVIVRYPV